MHQVFMWWDIHLNYPLQKFRREVIAWRHLRHQNILPLIGVNLGPQRLVMVSEWMDHGNINEFIENHEGVNRIQLVSTCGIYLAEFLLYCFIQLIDAANGLEYMHGISMVHGDLKGVRPYQSTDIWALT